MDAETWMNAKEAVKLGFADEILFSDSTAAPAEQLDNSSVEMLFSRKTVTDSLLSKLIPKLSKDAPEPETHNKKPAVKAAELQKRLSLLSH